jgi:hypothetical protein
MIRFFNTSGYLWPSDTVKSPGFFTPRDTHKGFGPPIVPCAPHLARWTHRNCITHPHWMCKKWWHLARPPAVAALAAIHECLWRTHRQRNTTFAVSFLKQCLPITERKHPNSWSTFLVCVLYVIYWMARDQLCSYVGMQKSILLGSHVSHAPKTRTKGAG